MTTVSNDLDRVIPHLTPEQADGLVCVVCGLDYRTDDRATAHQPVGRSTTGRQVFACWDTKAPRLCAVGSRFRFTIMSGPASLITEHPDGHVVITVYDGQPAGDQAKMGALLLARWLIARGLPR